MTERVSKKICELRQLVNSFFCLGFNRNLIKENERGIAELEDTCANHEDFVFRITNLASLVDDIDRNGLMSLIERKGKNLESIDLLEEFLEEKNLEKKNIIENLRTIKRIRNTVFPIHRGTSKEFLELMFAIGSKPPFDWAVIWRKCLGMYRNSLAELSDSLDAHNSKFKYGKLGKQAKKWEKGEGIVYLNDYLYRYRILIPTKSKCELETLIDYLTAALIAYDKDLKSIDYVLRKYVIPLKPRFREHTEDFYFVKKRKYINNEQLRPYGIMVSRDDIGIKDDKEFQRYFRYIWVSFAAYQMGVLPDWLIKEYWGPDYLSTGRTYFDQENTRAQKSS
jgi:hypothetical protein